MPSLRVTFDAGETRRELEQIPDEQLIHITEPDWQLIAFDKGMSSGLPSVALRINLPDGRVLVVETSAAIWVTSARALMGRYPELDAGPHMSDEQFTELQRLMVEQIAGAYAVPAEQLRPTGDQNKAAAGRPIAIWPHLGQACVVCGKPATAVYFAGPEVRELAYYCNEHAPSRPEGGA